MDVILGTCYSMSGLHYFACDCVGVNHTTGVNGKAGLHLDSSKAGGAYGGHQRGSRMFGVHLELHHLATWTGLMTLFGQ